MKKGKKIKKKADELPKTQSSSQVVINVKPNLEENTDVLPGYEQEHCEVHQIVNRSVCWNCCHEIEGLNVSQPIKYEQGVFKTVGNFCSYPCIARHIIESNDTSDVVFSRLSTLNMYVNIINKTRGKKVVPSPPRLLLKMFGGTMDISEYRSKEDECLTVMNIDPIVCCIDISVKKLSYKKKTTDENKKEFKLYRKSKKSTTNDIYASMNLISE